MARSVAAVTRQRDFDVPARELREMPRRQCGGVGERLVRVPGDALDDVDTRGLKHELVMTSAELLGDEPRMLALVERGFGEAHRKGVEPLAADLARERDDRGRVDSAREEH